jgi:hypothetical protein
MFTSLIRRAQPDDLSCFFNCNVVLGTEFDAITCPTIDMDRSMAAADASMARYAQSYVETIAARSATLDGKVTELVAALLPTRRRSLGRSRAMGRRGTRPTIGKSDLPRNVKSPS